MASTLRHLAYHQTTHLGTHKGARRLWLEGKRLVDVGFTPGVRYQVAFTSEGATLKLSVDGSHKVSRADRDKTKPVIDLLTRALGPVERVEVSFTPGALFISIHPWELAARDRLARLNARLAGGQCMRLGSLSHGGGIASEALLRGMPGSRLAFGLDIDDEYLQHAQAHNPAWTDEALSINADLRDVVAEALPEVDVLEAGLPCVAASRAGKSKKGLKFAEQDPQVAGLVEAFCDVIKATQPAVIVMENVPEYADSASAADLRDWLQRHAYVLHEQIVDGAAWALEARRRWVLVAVTRGLDIDLASLVPTERPERLGDVLDASASGWRDFAGLEQKAERDRAKGNGFHRGRRVLTPEATSVPTLRRGYQKAGSCDVRLAHPSQPGLFRLFTAAEHAAIKGIPPALVAGLSEKKAHEVLGQSVISPAFVGLGKLIAQATAA